ncbi:hypothetical protein [Streptomyces hainanensis]|uniref:hypothetical protein n=1 Tax=Streptomyces hainanensis TaxID=402648 RepID=UPI001405097C|nr:hypothetical protein [Streptomyces hainanensis]
MTGKAIGNRRPLVYAVVATCALCLGWLLPSAYTEDEEAGGAVIPAVEQQLDAQEQ